MNKVEGVSTLLVQNLKLYQRFFLKNILIWKSLKLEVSKYLL